MHQFPSDAGARSLLLLAPLDRTIPSGFGCIDTNPSRHAQLLAEMQKLRGRVYLEDGAIKADQLVDRRHIHEMDESSWHLLTVDSAGKVHGCARYREHPNHARFTDLTVARSALANCETNGGPLRQAVEHELRCARKMNLPYVELGGWALDRCIRGTMEALRVTMATYALSQSLGGAILISTVTQRHSSSSILRRIGGQPLVHGGQELPSYYDPEYNCGMEVLRFYSWWPNRRYEGKVAEMRRVLAATPVIRAGATSPLWKRTAARSRPFVSFAHAIA